MSWGHAPAAPPLTRAGQCAGHGEDDPAAAIGHKRGAEGKTKWSLGFSQEATEYIYRADSPRRIKIVDL
jgi:hypothetical protein